MKQEWWTKPLFWCICIETQCDYLWHHVALAYGTIFSCVSNKTDTSLNTYCSKRIDVCGVAYACEIWWTCNTLSELASLQCCFNWIWTMNQSQYSPHSKRNDKGIQRMFTGIGQSQTQDLQHGRSPPYPYNHIISCKVIKYKLNLATTSPFFWKVELWVTSEVLSTNFPFKK